MKWYEYKGFSNGSMGKESTCNAGDAGDLGSIPVSGRSYGDENGNPIQYSCLGDPMDCSPPGSSIHGILQARALEWGAIAFSTKSCQLFVTAWTTACQASLSFTISWSLLKFMSIELMMPSNHLILCCLLVLLPLILPTLGVGPHISQST